MVILGVVIIILSVLCMGVFLYKGSNIDPPGYQPDHYEDDDHNNGWP